MPAVLSHKEEVEWVTRPVGDQLEGLDRRLCLAGLHEVDGGPADVLAGDLAQAEPSLLAGLLDRARPDLDAPTPPADRKSTRLNSSHVSISYAVFCLKKK